MPTVADRFRVRRGTAADLAAVNEIPYAQEIVMESDQGLSDGKYKLKIGDGSTHYNDLPYVALGGIEGDDFAPASGADTITASFANVPALVDGLQFKVRAAGANTTTTPTFNPNSLGALTIKKLGGIALEVGDISGAGHEIILRYVASPVGYELVNPAGVQKPIGGSHINVDLTNPRKPIFAVTGLSAGAGYAEGTSFPASPGLHDKFYRNDLNLLCFYDGTRWLTVNQYETGPGISDYSAPASGTVNSRWPVRDDFLMYIERIACSIYSATVNGSNYWTGVLSAYSASNSPTSLKTISNAAGTTNNWYVAGGAVGVALTSATKELQISWTKTGSPGTLYAPVSLIYRLIVT